MEKQLNDLVGQGKLEQDVATLISSLVGRVEALEKIAQANKPKPYRKPAVFSQAVAPRQF